MVAKCTEALVRLAVVTLCRLALSGVMHDGDLLRMHSNVCGVHGTLTVNTRWALNRLNFASHRLIIHATQHQRVPHACNTALNTLQGCTSGKA